MLREVLLAGGVLACSSAAWSPAARASEAGFGGAPVEDDEPRGREGPARDGAAPAALEDGACMVRTDDGSWVSCDALLQESAPAEVEEPAPRADDFVAGGRAPHSLVQHLSDAPQAPPPKKLTPIEEDLAKIGRRVEEFPLAVLRRDVQRLTLDLAALEARGASLSQKGPLEEQKAALEDILLRVEAIAMHRMKACAARRGVKIESRSYRMTPAGPIALSPEEMIAALPKVDPEGCERVLLVDQAAVDRVKRLAEVKRVLATRSFGYHQVAERRKLEDERDRLEREIENDTAWQIFVPGAPGL